MAHNKLYRNFIILQEDERGNSKSNDKALSGYAKVEAKGDKCKVSFYAQNLEKENNYSMMLICSKRDLRQLVDLGPLVISDVGKGDTSKEYYINNIAGLGISYEKISGAAICKTKGNESEFIMHGFMNGEDSAENWRKFKVIKADSKVKDNIEPEVLIKDLSKLEIKQPEKNMERVPIKEKVLDENRVQEKGADINVNIEPEDSSTKNRVKETEEHIEADICSGDRSKNKEDNKHENIEECIINLGKKMSTYEGVLNFNISNLHEDVIIYGFIRSKKNDMCKWKKFKIEEKCKFNRQSSFRRIEENFRLDRLDDTDELYRNNRLDITDFENYEKEIEQAAIVNDIKEKTSAAQDFNMVGEVSIYFEKLADGFEPYDGSLNDINYCKLYKINVNNIQDLCDESDYNKYTLAYYPMLNYYPYISKSGYFLLGYKCNRNGEIQYIVYGIPGSKEKNDQPYGGKTGFVTWTMDSESGNGYWLMFYDFRNSSIVIPTM